MNGNDLRRLALALPESEERETWGEATFRVRGKIFVMMSADDATASVKASLDEQDIIIGSDPRSLSVAPYVGRFGWVRVKLATVDPEMMAVLVSEAWRRTAPRKLVAEFDAQP
ncbi:MAG: MmcQ/YjbR family DNA-binding protein [Chloroflexi bacterium]|nr:MmcQ/YjbR family DNA-binding protein [Chloroflexota bacterium]